MSDPRLPRYQQIRDAFLRNLANKTWPEGECIPSEAELAKTYEASVGTIRKAIDLLVSDGLIERVHGKGMFVRRPTFASSLFRFFRHSTEDDTPAMPTSRILDRRIDIPSGEVRKALKLAPAMKAIRMDRLRTLGSKSELLEEIWLPEARFPGFLALDPAAFEPLLYPAYEAQFGILITRAEETLSVMAGDAKINKTLGLKLSAPLMVIERCAFDHDNEPVEWRRSWGPAAGFRYRTEVR